jgi:hypothetical protein
VGAAVVDVTGTVVVVVLEELDGGASVDAGGIVPGTEVGGSPAMYRKLCSRPR